MLNPVRSAATRHLTKALVFAAALQAIIVMQGRAQGAGLPFEIGERLHYRVSVSKLGTVGEGEMSIGRPEAVRGTETLVLTSKISAKFGFVKKTERAESWIDPTRMAALRYEKRTRGAFTRDDEQHVEIYPQDQRWKDDRGRQGQSPTSAPLDELSFIYYLRTLPLDADSVCQVVRHYDPLRNPISLRVTGRDTVRTSAGTFPTVVVEMRVKDPRRYGGEGIIRLHLSDDAFRYPVRIESAVPLLGATVLTLESITHSPTRLARQPE